MQWYWMRHGLFPYNLCMAARTLPKILISAIAVVTGVGLSIATGVSADKGAWESKAPAPTKRSEVAAAALDGKIYVVGGFAKGIAFTSSLVEEYNPAGDSWRVRSPMPAGRHHAGIGVVNDRLYVIGGFHASLLNIWDPTATVYEYDPHSDQWTTRKPMPTARGALAVAVLDGKLHAIGGYGKDGNSAAHEVYDPATDTWSTAAPLHVARDHHAVAAVGGRLYAIGGRLNRQYSQNVVVNEMYDPSTNQWTPKADLPTARSGITAQAVGGRIYVFGGEAPTGTFRENEAYDPERDTWESQAPMPTSRHGLGSAVVGGKVYLLCGGPTPGGSFSDTNEVFAPQGHP